MVKRTRAASIVSSSPSSSVPSTSSNDYAEEEDSRPATRRRTNNNTRNVVTDTTPGSQSTDFESPSTSLAQDPKSARKQQRKERNRISAQHSRDRKKNESQELRGRLEEAETRVSALAADNVRLREENSRFKLELEKSSSLQGELSSLKERFEMLERLLLSGSHQQQQPLPSATSTAASLSTPTTLPNSSQSSISAPVQADHRIGSETHATGMHSLFRSTTSLDCRSGMTGMGRNTVSQQGTSSSSNSLQEGSIASSLPPSSITARSMISSTPTVRPLVTQALQRPSPAQQNRKTPSTRHLKTFSPTQAVSCLPTARLSVQDKQRFLLRRQMRQQALDSRQVQLARAKFITMTMIDSMSNNRRT